jgi:hypothetical protein
MSFEKLPILVAIISTRQTEGTRLDAAISGIVTNQKLTSAPLAPEQEKFLQAAYISGNGQRSLSAKEKSGPKSRLQRGKVGRDLREGDAR